MNGGASHFKTIYGPTGEGPDDTGVGRGVEGGGQCSLHTRAKADSTPRPSTSEPKAIRHST